MVFIFQMQSIVESGNCSEACLSKVCNTAFALPQTFFFNIYNNYLQYGRDHAIIYYNYKKQSSSTVKKAVAANKTECNYFYRNLAEIYRNKLFGQVTSANL